MGIFAKNNNIAKAKNQLKRLFVSFVN